MPPQHDAFVRYHRQTLLPQVGADGQLRLASSRAVVVGCGTLGCPAADLLVRAGVGTVTVIDRDVVEPTNLQRQTLFTDADARDGTPKAIAAQAALARANPAVTVHAIVDDVTPASAEQLLGLSGGSPPGVVIDGTDSFQTRFLLNDACVKHGVPFVCGGAVGTGGTALTVLPRRTPCLRCVLPVPPEPGAVPTCDTAGVLGSAGVAIAALQAAEAIKILLGREDAVLRGVLQLDVWTGTHRRIGRNARPDSDCACCGRSRFEFLEQGASPGHAVLCGRDAVQVDSGRLGVRLDLGALAERLAPHGLFAATPYLVRGVLRLERGAQGAPIELTVFPSGRAIVRGVTDPVAARGLYARYIGT